MKTFNGHSGWLLPAILLLTLLGFAEVSRAASPKVAAGESHSVILHADGTLWASGANLSGQLGDGTRTGRSSAVRIGSDASWQTVAAGAEHTLALKADGTLWAWGSNASGQLGALKLDGTPVGDQSAPLRIGSARDWVALAAGTASSYALKADGTLWAWGLGSAGQLGNGLLARQDAPVQVLNPAGGRYLAVAAGADHALALMADGSLWSWGANASGQLGRGLTPSDPATPQQIVSVSAPSDNDWSAIAAGGNFSLALKADGSLWSWGDNAAGQLGLGAAPEQNVPAQVGSDRDWAALAAGALHVLALKRSGLLYGWGDNSSGQLGDGQLAQQNTPKAVAGAANLVALSAGPFHSLALKASGEVYAWGGNLDGQLGTGGATGTLTPTPAGSVGLGWQGVEPGNQFTVARRSNGTLWSWGDNGSGQLGNGSPGASATPAQLDTRSDWAAFSAGFGHVVALKADGTLWSWGDNSSGQLGDNSRDPSPFPLQVTDSKPASALNDWAAVAAGDFHTLALKGDGTLWAWGDNSTGQLGDASNSSDAKLPEQIVTGNPGNFDSNWVAIAAGGGHSLGLQADGTLWAWGDNSDGQLGDPGVVGSLNTPNQVISFTPPPANPGFNSGWKAIAAGFGHSVGLQADGTLWAWGRNFDGQLGNGDATQPNPPGQPQPVLVQNPGAVPFVALAAGDAHSLGRQADGTLWSWGRNLDGQLGNGSLDATPLPHATPVGEGTAAAAWSASGVGGSHSVALRADGTLWAWGNNFTGQLGDGSDLDRNLPTPLQEGFAAVGASLDLGRAFLGGAPVTRSLAVSNTGIGNLFVTALALSGGSAAQFGVTPGSCGSQSAFLLAPGTSCQLGLSFQPGQAAGVKGALLEITSNDPVQPKRQVSLTAQAAQHQVTLSAGPNGSIFGPSAVNENSTPSYSIVAATTYRVADVLVNGVSRGPVATLTLPPVQADLTITASFAINTFPVDFAAGANGSLAGTLHQVVPFGSATATVTALPAAGYHLVDWTEGLQVVGSNAALTVSGIVAPHSYTANFAINSYPVSFASGGNGTLSGPTSQTIIHGAAAQTVTAQPSQGHHFLNWSDGSGVVSSSAALTLASVTGARSLTANFAIDTFTVQATSDAKGSVSPAGGSTVNYGAGLSFTFTPAAGYQVVDVVVDGVSQGAPGSYTLSNVTANGHTVRVVFIPDGDLDGDGQVGIADALVALQLAVGLNQPTPSQLRHGDLAPLDAGGIPAPDAQIQVADALVVLRKAVGLTSGF